MASAGRSWRIVGAVAGAAAIGCLDANPKFIEPSGGSDGSTGGATTDATTAETTSATTGAPTSGPTSDTEATTSAPTTGPVTTTSPPPGCGDGLPDPGEECDDGPANADDAPCTSQCALATCGDGLVLADVELCDAGPANDDEGACKTDCTPAMCGDSLVAAGIEECDLGADNADDAACTSQCKLATCGDGVVYQETEDCEDGNAVVEDGCVQCVVPRSCADIKALADPMLLKDGKHMIDPDGPGPNPTIPVWCDMTTDGGGWTLVERSPRSQPIGRALFEDVMINIGVPEAPQYRMPKMVIAMLLGPASDLRIDCGGGDYLLADPPALFAGEGKPNDCELFETVMYKQAQLKGVKIDNAQICTGMVGKSKGCDGAWRIDEAQQMLCGLPELPWMEMLAPFGADLFAVDASQIDPDHDCHMPGAAREIKVR